MPSANFNSFLESYFGDGYMRNNILQHIRTPAAGNRLYSFQANLELHGSVPKSRTHYTTRVVELDEQATPATM